MGEDDSASVEAGLAQVVKVTHAAAEGGGPDGFTRQMPKWVRIKLFNTGAGLKAGDADPHWQLVARSDDPHFKPRPAVVAGRTPSYIIDDPARSQWISAVGDLTPLPDDVTYTFRTTFDLTGTLPGAAVLRGKFLVDNRVDAVRLNGRNLDVPENGYSSLPLKPYEFRAAEGFVEGTNVLEINVFNGIPFNAFRSSSPMACRVELEGSVLCAPATTSDGPRPTDRKSVEPRTRRRSGKPSQGKEVSR